jgi:hypothetical protein
MFLDESFHKVTSPKCHVHDNQELRVDLGTSLDHWHSVGCIFDSKVGSALMKNALEWRQIFYPFPSPSRLDPDMVCRILCPGVGAFTDGSLQDLTGSLLGMVSKSVITVACVFTKSSSHNWDLSKIYFHASSL